MWPVEFPKYPAEPEERDEKEERKAEIQDEPPFWVKDPLTDA